MASNNIILPKYPGQGCFLDARPYLNDLLTDVFSWDFGDLSPIGRGFVVCHAFDQPGDYRVLLDIYGKPVETVSVPDGSPKVTTKTTVEKTVEFQVVVAPDNRPVVTVQPGQDYRTLLQNANNQRIIFPAGVYHQKGSVSITGKDVSIEASGATFFQDDRGTILRCEAGSERITIRGSAFDSRFKQNAGHIDCSAIESHGSNVIVRECSGLDVDNLVTLTDQSVGFALLYSKSGKGAPAYGSFGLRGYHCWIRGLLNYFAGNLCEGSQNEHCFRASNFDGLTFFGDQLSNPNSSKTCIAIHRGIGAFVRDVTARFRPIEVGPQGGGDDPHGSSTEQVRLEGVTLMDAGFVIHPGAHHVLIDDYEIVRGGEEGITIETQDQDGRKSDDIRIGTGGFAFDSTRKGNNRPRAVSLGAVVGKVSIDGLTMTSGTAPSGDSIISISTDAKDFSNVGFGKHQWPQGVPARIAGKLVPSP